MGKERKIERTLPTLKPDVTKTTRDGVFYLTLGQRSLPAENACQAAMMQALIRESQLPESLTRLLLQAAPPPDDTAAASAIAAFMLAFGDFLAV
ncbi:MAG: hypothetical protein VB023_05130 [Oscillibacter sp.]|nr:hypothetical protein [Oscillibacter sp.]